MRLRGCLNGQAFQPDSFQEQIANRVLAGKRVTLLGSPPGSGKTAAILYAIGRLGEGFHVVVAPSVAVASHWARTAGELLDARAELATTRAHAVFRDDCELLVITQSLLTACFKDSYRQTVGGLFARRADEPEHALFRRLRAGVRVLGVDEVHHFTSDLANAVLRCLSSFAAVRIGASGTPLTNSPNDIAQVLRGLGEPSALRTVAAWSADGRSLRTAALQAFQERLLVRGRAPEMPPLQISHVAVAVALGEESKRKYNHHRAQARSLCRRRGCGPQLMVQFAAMQRLVARAKMHSLARRARELLAHEPLVIVSPWCSVLHELADLLDTKTATFSGEMTQQARQRELASFTEGRVKCLLLSLKAGSEGIDGLQTVARRMLITSPTFTDAAVEQAAARLHRRGQTRECFVEVQVMAGSIDDSLVQLARDKRCAHNLLLDASDLRGEQTTFRSGASLSMSIPKL